MRVITDTATDARLAAAVIPTNMLCHLVQLAREQRIDSTPWFKGMRLDVREIDDPATRVSYRQASEVVSRALATLARPDLGLVVGCRQDVGNFGLLGLAMKTAATFGEAV
ncbi:MAG TPA: AraC family transcriptional regulator ligand-binding domain-containing protein, partial [Pseudoxanthomonas sp.]|nr:AraC family transcriptional regulator ligand-binding domain-containing protein [Pseudoxanthomonas sp.]